MTSAGQTSHPAAGATRTASDDTTPCVFPVAPGRSQSYPPAPPPPVSAPAPPVPSALLLISKSKDELIKAIFEFYKTEFTQIMPPEERLEVILSSMPPDEFLRQGNARFMQRMSAPLIEKIWRILFSEQYRDARARDLVLQDMIQLPLAYAELVFTKMIEMGLIRRFDPKILAAEYQYSVSFIFTTFLMLDAENPDPNSIQKKLADHVSFFWNIIRKEKEKQ